MKVLFVVPPLVGHTLPTVAVADELRRGGHEVVWASYRNLVTPMLPEWAEVVAVAPDVDPGFVRDISRQAEALRGFAALKFLYDDLFLPMAREMAPGVDDAIDQFGPDVVVSDIQAFAGAAVARRRGLRYVTSVSTWAELTGQLSALPKVAQRLHESLVDLQLELGVAAATATSGDLRVSDHLTLVYSDPAFVGELQPPAQTAGRIAYVGPVLPRRDSGDARWSVPGVTPEQLAGSGPTVLVTMGTVFADAVQSFLARVLEAAREIPARVVVTAADVGTAETPDNVVVVPRVPYLALLAHLDAVLCHGGANTVSEALSFGVPLVVAPIRDDHPIIAEEVVRAGAGLRLRYARSGADEIAQAVNAVLSDDTYRQAAGRLASAFAAAGGAAAAARLIEELVG